jgi:hypothetical protein
LKVEDSTLAVVRALERIGVRHYVTGSLASSLHGEPRATNDADLVAELRLNHFEPLRAELSGRFYLDEDDFRAAVERGRSFNLVDEVELAKVDVFCVSGAGYPGAALARAVHLELEPGDPFTGCAVSSAEDCIISKLRWYRLGGEVSDRQWRDVLSVIEANRSRIDLDYLKLWCADQGVSDLLARALSAAR